jgi:hypothetical protein
MALTSADSGVTHIHNKVGVSELVDMKVYEYLGDAVAEWIVMELIMEFDRQGAILHGRRAEEKLLLSPELLSRLEFLLLIM